MSITEINGGGGNVNSFAKASANQDVLKTLNWIKARLESGSSEATIVDTYRSGSTWYRVWSDGFIEQGFSIAQQSWKTNTDTTNGTESLPKAFTSSSYVAIIQTTYRTENECEFHVVNKKTSSFSIGLTAYDARAQTASFSVYCAGY